MGWVRGILIALLLPLAACGGGHGNADTLARARAEAAKVAPDAVLVSIEFSNFGFATGANGIPDMTKAGPPQLALFNFYAPGSTKGLRVVADINRAPLPAEFAKAMEQRGYKDVRVEQADIPYTPLTLPLPDDIGDFDKAIEAAARTIEEECTGGDPRVSTCRLVQSAELHMHRAGPDDKTGTAVWTVSFGQNPKTYETVLRRVTDGGYTLYAGGDDQPAGNNQQEQVPTPVAVDPAPVAPTDADAGQAFASAQEQLNAGNTDAALAALDRAIGLDPAYGEALLLRASIYQRLGRDRDAMADLDAAARVLRTAAKALNERGAALSQAGKPDEALRDFREAARLAPGSAVPLFNQALVLKEQGSFDAELAALDGALALDPNDAPAYMERGLIFARWGWAREAAAEFDRGDWLSAGLRDQYAARIATAEQTPAEPPAVPSAASASLSDGIRLIVTEQDRDAAAQLSAVIRREPGNADAWLYRAKAYYNLRQDAVALSDLKEAMRLRPDDAETHRMLGRAYVALGDGDRGLAEYGEAIRLDPAFAMAFVDRGAATMQFYPNRVGSAQQDFQAAIDADPTNPYAWYNRAATYGGDALPILQGKASYDPRPGWQASIRDLAEAIRLKPDFAAAYASRGLLALAWAMFEKDAATVADLNAKGRADIEQALTLKPSLRAEVSAEIDALQDLPQLVASVQETFDSLRAGLLVKVPASSSSSAGPCANYRDGAASACRAQDWMAVDRYGGGRATSDDRQKYGNY